MKKNFAVIFDMDGVLVDNSLYHKRAFAEFNNSGSEFKNEMFGMSNEDIFKILFPEIKSKDKYKIMAEEKEEYYRKIFAPVMKPVKGLIELLKELKKEGIKIALGSSAPRANVNFVLDGLNIRQYFDQIVDSSNVTKCKPDPEIYIKAAEFLKISPNKCIVFEDAISGIEAAKRAGMKVIGVSTTHTIEELKHTDMQITNFETITPEILSELV